MAVQTDEVLQAVVIAESFNARFQPLTAGKPRVRNYYILILNLLRTCCNIYLFITAICMTSPPCST